MASGITPKMKARLVMRIGRNRILAALSQPGANNDMVAWLQAIEANTRRTVAGPSVASVQARAAEFA